MAKSTLKLHFLGTGSSQGVPVIGSDHPVCLSNDYKDKRLRSSLLLEKNNRIIIIDCGPDFRQQILRYNAQHLDAILFTHEHNDHVSGLDDIRPFIFKSGKNMPIYALNRVLQELKKRFPYLYSINKDSGIGTFIDHPIEYEHFDLFDFHIEPIEVLHGNLPILGYIIDHKVAYLTDVKTLPKKTLNQLKGIDILIIGALRKENEHFSHLLLHEAVEYAMKIGAKKTYFTHLSHYIGFYETVKEELPKNMFLAYDTLEISL